MYKAETKLPLVFPVSVQVVVDPLPVNVQTLPALDAGITPVAPCGPVAPVAPVVPVSPITPVAPVVPCAPWIPVAPVVP